MPEIGAITGAAVNMNFDQQINDLYRQDQMRQRSQAIGEAKNKMFIDDLDFQNAMNEYDAPKVKEYAKGKIMEIAQLYKNNPNLMSDPNGLMKLKLLKNDLKSNQVLLKGLATDEAFKRLNADMAEVAKNPNQYDVGAYEKLLAQKNNYLKFGNQDGEEAAKKEGEKVFLYSKPQEFIDENELFRKVGTSLKANDYENIRNGNIGAHRTFLNEKDLEKEAMAIYLSRQRQFDVKYKEKGLEPVKVIMDGIRPYVETKLDLGHENTFAKQMAFERYKHDLKRADNAAANGGSPYRISLLEPGATAPPAKTLAAVFGSNIPTFYKDASGRMVQNKDGDVFNYYDDFKDKGYGQQGYKKTGIKQPTGYFVKPLDWGKEQGYLHDKWLDGKDLVVKPEFADRVSVIDSPVDEKGNSHKLLKVEAIGEVNANDPSYEAAYNKLFLTNKQRENVEVEESLMSTPQSYNTSISALKQAGYSDSQIKQGVQQGIFIIK